MTYSTPIAKYTRKCSECQEYIISGKDKIVPLYPDGSNWVHEHCFEKYWLKETLREDLKLDEQQEMVRNQQERFLEDFNREGTLEDLIENGGW